jgi:polar amino acid transport system permease protein
VGHQLDLGNQYLLRSDPGNRRLWYAPLIQKNLAQNSRHLYRVHPLNAPSGPALFFYLGLPSLHININEVETGILALSLNSGAYIAEIIRAGIVSIPNGQTEAATAYGLSYFQRMRYIILPQAIGVTIPALLGQFIVLVKDSSLVSLISVLELTRAAQLMASERFMPAEGFFTVAAFYLLIYYALKYLSIWWQNRLIFMEGK